MVKQFPLGLVVATAGVANLAAQDGRFAAFVQESLSRHAACDWGDLCEEDRQQNDDAIVSKESRLFSAYVHPAFLEWKIWIITEYDYSATTVLFPSDY